MKKKGPKNSPKIRDDGVGGLATGEEGLKNLVGWGLGTEEGGDMNLRGGAGILGTSEVGVGAGISGLAGISGISGRERSGGWEGGGGGGGGAIAAWPHLQSPLGAVHPKFCV